jgi:hypothetical protein
MITLAVYARLYATCLGRAFKAIGKSPWTLLLPIGLLAALLFASRILGQLGLVGGILMGLGLDALISCYLYFVSELVGGSRVSLNELKKSFGAYFWAVLNLLFVVWVGQLMMGAVLARNPHADVISAMVEFAAFVLLNAAPEVLYVRGTYGGLATSKGSIDFIHANWIEWFVPNLLLGAAFYYGVPLLLDLGVPRLAVAVLAGALLHVAMVFRGNLFVELDKSTHRQRLYRWRSSAAE